MLDKISDNFFNQREEYSGLRTQIPCISLKKSIESIIEQIFIDIIKISNLDKNYGCE